MMQEVLSMSLFTRLGLPAPREAFVRLYVNNTLVGLYAVVESIDKQFLERVFNQDNGNLFEYDYTIDYNFEYLGSDLEPYATLFSPKTNETHPKFDLYDPIERMVRAVNQTADAAFEGALTQFLDLATFMKHVAVETFVAENDGLLGYAGMNNFYIYQFQDRPQFQVITWDKDNAFFQADFPLFLRADRNVLMRRALTIPAARQAYLDGVIAAADSAAEGQVGADGGTGWLAREDRAVVCADPVRVLNKTRASRTATLTSRPLWPGCGCSPAFVADSCDARWPTSRACPRPVPRPGRRRPRRAHCASEPTSTRAVFGPQWLRTWARTNRELTTDEPL